MCVLHSHTVDGALRVSPHGQCWVRCSLNATLASVKTTRLLLRGMVAELCPFQGGARWCGSGPSRAPTPRTPRSAASTTSGDTQPSRCVRVWCACVGRVSEQRQVSGLGTYAALCENVYLANPTAKVCACVLARVRASGVCWPFALNLNL